MKPLIDTLREIAKESGKNAGEDRYGPNVMAKMAKNEVSMERYVEWLESQPIEMLEKTYWILMTGWGERREGLVNVTTLFRDALTKVKSRTPSKGSRKKAKPEAQAEASPHVKSKKKKKKKKCCDLPKIVKLKKGGKKCKSCGKKWKPKAKA